MMEEKKSPSKSISDLEEEAVRTPVIDFVNRLLSNAIRSRASDIHVEPREDSLSIRYRVDGMLHESFPPPKEMQGAIITRIKLLSEMNIAEQRLPQDGRLRFEYEGRDVDVRTASTPTAYGEKIVMRLLDKTGLIVNMEDMGMPHRDVEKFKSILQQPYGMVLVTGPTGSGKTTTLYSALNHISTPDKNIVTIEDPIEYQIAGINQIQTKAQIGLTFASGLRAVLRQDPDIIMIGEIRDFETVDIAIKAALTGHLVLSTLHTTTAAGSVTRLINMGVEPFLITSSVILVAAQRLVRKICQNCKEPYELDADVVQQYGVKASGKKVKFYRGKGCDVCRRTGYRGRVGLIEVLTLTPKIKTLILQSAQEYRIMEQARLDGMTTLRENGIALALDGVTTLDEIVRVTVGDQEIGAD
jgi:type II secretory ATPase GspE/PulE/Tfp pilus assembly ATPase PilB-like protein